MLIRRVGKIDTTYETEWRLLGFDFPGYRGIAGYQIIDALLPNLSEHGGIPDKVADAHRLRLSMRIAGILPRTLPRLVRANAAKYQKMGAGKNTVVNWISTKDPVPRRLIPAVADALQVPVKWLTFSKIWDWWNFDKFDMYEAFPLWSHPWALWLSKAIRKINRPKDNPRDNKQCNKLDMVPLRVDNRIYGLYFSKNSTHRS